MIKKIIFDLDNTLLFISNEWKDSYRQFINKYDLRLEPEELFEIIGTFEKENKNSNLIINKSMVCDFITNKISTKFDEYMLDELLNEYKDVTLLDLENIYDILEYLYKKYELIVYSNWFTQNQIERLEKWNLKKFFKDIYGWDRVEIKPSKKGIEKIVKNENMEEFLFVGDNIEIDLSIPKAMGMNTIFLNLKNIKQDMHQEILKITELKNIL